MKSIDTIYRVQKPAIQNIQSKPSKKAPLYYFYKSLQIVFSIWIVTILAVITQPWLDLWAKSLIKENQNNQVMGQSTIASSTIIDNTSTFQLQNAKVTIEAPIVEGIDNEALKKGIGHQPDSVWPSEKGNVVLAGHNYDLDADNPYREVFISLRLVEIGDEVVITDQGKKYHYQVFKKETVSPKDTNLFGQSDEWLLTFYTCDPPYTDWKRLVLQAKLTRIE